MTASTANLVATLHRDEVGHLHVATDLSRARLLTLNRVDAEMGLVSSLHNARPIHQAQGIQGLVGNEIEIVETILGIGRRGGRKAQHVIPVIAPQSTVPSNLRDHDAGS